MKPKEMKLKLKLNTFIISSFRGNVSFCKQSKKRMLLKPCVFILTLKENTISIVSNGNFSESAIY